MKMKIVLLIFSFLYLAFLTGCNKEEPLTVEDTNLQKPVNSCEGCHTDYVHTPDRQVKAEEAAEEKLITYSRMIEFI